MRLLILGGTTEASRLAATLDGRADVEAIMSFAGRTAKPRATPLPQRIGGFGGVDGLVDYLVRERIGAVVDATHPFAARISANAVPACDRLGLPLLAYSRRPWAPAPNDRWIEVPDIDGAVAKLREMAPARVFLTTGRLDLAAFRQAPQHDYLVRTIDPLPAGDALPTMTPILGRGPFAVEEEAALMAQHGVSLLVTKNSGGTASEAKLNAARQRGVEVLMVARPTLPHRLEVDRLDDALAWIAAHRSPR